MCTSSVRVREEHRAIVESVAVDPVHHCFVPVPRKGKEKELALYYYGVDRNMEFFMFLIAREQPDLFVQRAA
jgi:hypothetical protein